MGIQMNQQLVIPTRTFGFEYDLELHNWNSNLNAYRVFNNKSKELIEGGIGLGLNLISQFYADTDWENSIPKEYLKKTAPFVEHQYQMLWLVANSEPAKQLLMSRPLLLVLICEHFAIDNRMALTLSNLGQRDILKSLGYDGSKAALKFIDKLALDFERNIELEHVKKQLDARFCRHKVFKHYSRVNFAALSLDSKFPFLTGSRLGQYANNCQIRRVSLVRYLSDTLMLGIELGVNDPTARVRELASLEELQELHHLWIEQRNNIRAERREKVRPDNADLPYPELIPGNEYIVPIKNYDELINEGKSQKHCIAVYHHRIVGGHYCAFTMIKPERVTIGVSVYKKDKHKHVIQLDQIAGKCNALPTNETRELVYKWLEAIKKDGIRM